MDPVTKGCMGMGTMVRGTGGDPQNSLSRRPKMEGSEVMTASKGKVISSL